MALRSLQLLLLAACLLRVSAAARTVDENDFLGDDSDLDGDDIGEVGVVNEQEKLVGGKVERQRIDELPPEQAKEEIKKLIAKIDTDSDGILDRGELIAWLVKIEEGYEKEELDDQWDEADTDKDGYVSYKEILDVFYSMEGGAEANLTMEQYEHELVKFERVDFDKDKKLNKEEFIEYINPTRPDIVKEVLQDYLGQYDSNKDGFISLQEYLAIFAGPDVMKDPPEWVQNEIKEFQEVYDTNEDGLLNLEEMKEWMKPGHTKLASDEADHLLKEADKNKDSRLSLEEVLAELNVFLESEITDYGSMGLHDEL